MIDVLKNSPLLLPLTLPIVYLLFLFTVALLEKHRVAPYIPVELEGDDPEVLTYERNTPRASQLPDYVIAMSNGALTAGFINGGLMAHAQAPKIRVLATLWISRDRSELVLSGAGTIINIPTRQTWIYTPLKDGTLVVTTDGNDSGDLSGIYRTKRVLNVRFDSLLAAHRNRVEGWANQRDRFIEKKPKDILQAIVERRVHTMVNRGRARMVDVEEIYWSYTFKGSLIVCGNFFVQLADALPQVWRVNRKSIASPKLNKPGSLEITRKDDGDSIDDDSIDKDV